ncbi:MAG: hypothetical protein N2450_08690 [bacterium]|nr:hypothetical protein [bacterium]
MMHQNSHDQDEFSFSKQRIEEWKERNLRMKKRQNVQNFVWILVALGMLLILFAVTKFLSSPTIQKLQKQQFHSTQQDTTIQTHDTFRIIPKPVQK